MFIHLSGTPGWKTLLTIKVNITPGHTKPRLGRIILHEKKSPLELPHAIRSSTLKWCVGTLKDGYVRNVPLLQVQQIQSASHTTSHELIVPKIGISLPGHLHVPRWIPKLPKLGSILGFSQRLL